MKSGVALVAGISSFLLGIGFYHFCLLNKPGGYVYYTLPFIAHYANSLSDKTNGNSLALQVSLNELVRGPLAQNDSRILSYIKENGFLRPPASATLPYNLTNPQVQDPSMGQSKLVRHALNDMRNGFFVECGALDGELRSNTLALEKKFGWTGLLIEGDPKNFQMLLNKNRKAWTTHSCLATKKFPHQVMFQQHFNRGRISSKSLVLDEQDVPSGFARVQCFPLFSLLSAMNVSSVDYFSLDVEGSELDVLKTIPFDNLWIKVLSVEYLHDKGGREAVKKFMTSKGYRVFGEVTDPRNWANDLIFVNNRLQ